MNVAYERQVKKTFSEGSYRRLVRHSKNLEPNELFDNKWLDRELLRAIVIGLAQMGEYKSRRPFFELLTLLPTGPLMKILRWTDRIQGESKGRQYALSLSKKTLTREEAATGKYSWRVWRYQQCTETGVFAGRDKTTCQLFQQRFESVYGTRAGGAHKDRWSQELPRSWHE